MISRAPGTESNSSKMNDGLFISHPPAGSCKTTLARDKAFGAFEQLSLFLAAGAFLGVDVRGRRESCASGRRGHGGLAPYAV